MPVGYPAPDARVPDLHRKPLDEIAVWFEPSADGSNAKQAGDFMRERHMEP